MRLEVYSDEEDVEYVPEFNGNRELTAEGDEEHIVATLRPLSGVELAKIQRGFSEGEDKALKAVKRILADRVVGIRGLRLDLSDHSLRPSTGKELWEASQRFASVLDPLVIELVKAAQDCSVLAEGDLKKFYRASDSSAQPTHQSAIGSVQNAPLPNPPTSQGPQSSAKPSQSATGFVPSADATTQHPTTYDQIGTTP